jgi:hypothetical protein
MGGTLAFDGLRGLSCGGGARALGAHKRQGSVGIRRHVRWWWKMWESKKLGARNCAASRAKKLSRCCGRSSSGWSRGKN